MAVVTQEFPVAPADVWDVLQDGWRYSNWVVGTSHMRAVASMTSCVARSSFSRRRLSMRWRRASNEPGPAPL